MTHQQALESMAAERYLLDEMSELERHRFEEHYFACEACAADVRLGAEMREQVRAIGPDVPTARADSGRPRTTWSRVALVVPWAAAAALAIVAGYQSLFVTPALRRMVTTQALEPVALRSASRGEVPTVHPVATRPFVAFTLDIDASPRARAVSYILRRGSAGPIRSGEAPVPAPGMPLLLLVPAGDIDVPGEYVLLITDTTSATATSEFPFRVGDR